MFRKEDKRRQKLALFHQCQLPDINRNLLVKFIDSGYFVDLRRKFRAFMMCNEKNPRSKLFLKSTASIHLEKQNHLHLHYYMIHPFSLMRVCWELFMMVIMCILLVYIPVDICLAHQEQNIQKRLPRMILDSICIIDIYMSFMTGYQNSKTKKIIMDPKKVAKNYVCSWFALDFLSSFNADIVIMILHLFGKEVQTTWFFKIPSFLKICRFSTLFKYMDRFREWKQYSLYKFKLMKLAIIMALMVIWCSSCLFITARQLNEVWMPAQNTDEAILEGLRLAFSRIILNFMLICHGEKNSEKLAIISLEVVFLSVGWTVKLAVTAQIVQIVMKYSSLSDKYYQMVQQFQEYMKSKNLPESVQNRVLAYFEFRFQRNYYKENEILGSLSNQLKQEIIVHTCSGLLGNTTIFKDIPYAFLVRICYCMKMEIYLPNDVVVSAGSEANSMYFIVTGMVAIYDSQGKEVCHLADKAYFGEMSLFVPDEVRNASVVSIDFCEMYTLSRTDFAEAIAPYPDLLHKMESTAKDRLSQFLLQETNSKYDLENFIGPKILPSKTRQYYRI